MKKFSVAFLCGIFFIVNLIGCLHKENIVVPNNNYYTEYSGVYLTIESVETVGEDQKINVKWHNQTDFEVVYVPVYHIEYKNGEEWVNTQTVDFNCDYLEFVIPPHSEKMQKYSTWGFDLSKIGLYRLRTSCVVLNENRQTCGLWIEFEVDRCK